MNRIVWRIALDTKDYEANDLSGNGAKKTGGRWNEEGVPLVYTSETVSLAVLETLVHLNSGGLPLNRYLVEITIPDSIWTAALTETADSLPVGWEAEPAGRTSIAFGTKWARRKETALLRVPSVVVPEESNVLINPEHPDVAEIHARKVRQWIYDPRLFKSAAAGS